MITNLNDFKSRKNGSVNEATNNYMFFQNLQIMKEAIEKMMQLDQSQVDSILSEHNWALDHIATSKDDVTEVCEFLCSANKNNS